jgi:hypothetical protein
VDEKAFEPFYSFGEGEDTWLNPDDGRIYEGLFVPVWRWRQAFFNDIRCRMDWCIESFEDANHHPVAVLNGDASNEILIQDVKSGDQITLSAKGSSDPDGDELEYRWWFYPEAGTYDGVPVISEPDGLSTSVTFPPDGGNGEIHIILEVKDRNEIASLWDYRRMVFQVKN